MHDAVSKTPFLADSRRADDPLCGSYDFEGECMTYSEGALERIRTQLFLPTFIAGRERASDGVSFVFQKVGKPTFGK
jgi:hypothetical protein